MIEKTEKSPLQISETDTAPEEALPRLSLTDSKTWSGLLDSVENIRYSTQTIFKLSGKHLIHTAHNMEPIFLYDNIILGMSCDRLAFLFDGKFKYANNELLSKAISQERYELAKLVFGTSISGYIFDELKKKYKKAFDVDEYCSLVHLTFQFEMCQLSSAVSQWVCEFLDGQAALEGAPAELRTADFQSWESSRLPAA